jgi:sorbitol-specific phosphotransferase system component IIC
MKNIDPSIVVAGRNRGILLDVVVFLVNLFLMSDLSDHINDVIGIGGGRAGSARSMGILAGYCALACLLPAGGALLKYVSGSQKHTPHFYRKTWGRQFFSIMNLILVLQFVSQVVFLIGEYVYQGRLLSFLPDSGGLSILLKILLPICAIFILANPFIVRMNFVKNRRHYLTGFSRSLVEFLGDSCLFLNMILFQVFWGIFMRDITQDWDGVLERVLALAITSLLLYFPPRLMYSAEDGHRGISWITMLLANIPIIIRIIIAD